MQLKIYLHATWMSVEELETTIKGVCIRAFISAYSSETSGDPHSLLFINCDQHNWMQLFEKFKKNSVVLVQGHLTLSKIKGVLLLLW